MHGDTDLKASVLAELAQDPSFVAAHIGVTADDGVVSLSGRVATSGEKHAAVMAAERVEGVNAVVGGIEVRPSGAHLRDDQDVARAAVSAIAWQADDHDCAIKIDIEDGRIALTGHVARMSQRDDVECDLSRVPGVTGLDNLLTIKPHVSIKSVAAAITHAIGRSWMFDPNSIDVSAEGGSVRLSGTVRTLHDRYLAGTTAWTAAGVTDVRNDIRVV
jgi:osmotically-inducible protein OsmY